jgi:hypothetical protein
VGHVAHPESITSKLFPERTFGALLMNFSNASEGTKISGVVRGFLLLRGGFSLRPLPKHANGTWLAREPGPAAGAPSAFPAGDARPHDSVAVLILCGWKCSGKWLRGFVSAWEIKWTVVLECALVAAMRDVSARASLCVGRYVQSCVLLTPQLHKGGGMRCQQSTSHQRRPSPQSNCNIAATEQDMSSL